jgi:hypothetical protein
MTRHSYDLYGVRDLSTESLRSAVESALNISFSLHESYFLGGDYLLFSGSVGEELRIRTNEISDEDGSFLTEPDFGDYVTLLSISRALDGDSIRERLASIPGLDFLRREIV